MSKKNQSYDEFVEKFKPKKTTDDCYTPPVVYDAVLQWAHRFLPVGDRPVVRPFWPGADYRSFDYPARCVVIDNPPFSCFAEIVNFYVTHDIPFLLFAPAMSSIRSNCTFVACGVNVTYENGACVNTSFVTNMLGPLICTSAPELYRCVKLADEHNLRSRKKQPRRLVFPDCVLRAATLHTLSRAGVRFAVTRQQGRVVGTACDSRSGGGSEFGNSVLLSDSATAEKLAAEKLAAEKLAAEKLAAERLQLSERSRAILTQLNNIGS